MRGVMPPPPTELELYANANGMIVIRTPHKSDPTKYSVHETGSSQLSKARKALVRYLTKNGIKDVNVAKVPLNSIVGPIPEDASSVSGYIREKRGITRTPVRSRSNGADLTVTARAVMKGHKIDLEELRALVQILATSLGSVSTALRLLQERIGEPTLNDT